VSPATLRAQAHAELFKSFQTYDPSRGTQPTTHIWNNLQHISRIATESLTSGHIPEARNLKRSTYTTVKTNLADQLGYEPSVDEIADELKWDREEVGRMESELGGEVTASGAKFDFYGNATTQEGGDKALADYLYNDLSGPDKTIFEHTFGYGGKPILNNKGIAKRLNISEMAVGRSKKRMANKIKEYR
jgi:DNA-directed RNA polymerase specialized sigma subunit